MSVLSVNNLPYNVPSQVKSLFYNCIPAFSDYVIYTKSYTQSTQLYECIIRRAITHDIEVYQVSHQNGGDYVLSHPTNSLQFSGFEVSSPYYAYSSERSQGISETLPVHTTMISFLCIVIASLLVLKTVFGGIRIWSQRRLRL